ncbi:MAG: two-component system sensor histidine kinase NtrB [Bdellovibrionota bacterium]|jgi:two-component system sensor histidine kinase FlrB
MNNSVVSETRTPQDTQALLSAFGAFTQASHKLQYKYDLLVKEAQALRDQLAIKEEEVKRSERLAMLGKTAGEIAHEVRNPLGSIKLFVSLLKQDLKDQPASLELVQQIEKSMSALDNVISNILHFAKDTKPQFAPINMHLLLKEQLQEVSRAGFDTSKIHLTLNGNPYLNGNEAALKQVINNLVINAIQAPDSTAVQITYADSAEGGAIMEVSDNGAGVPQTLLDKVFDPFVSMKKGGTGLGLAIVKRILDQHGATISVKNCKGACFTVVFPRK